MINFPDSPAAHFFPRKACPAVFLFFFLELINILLGEKDRAEDLAREFQSTPAVKRHQEGGEIEDQGKSYDFD